MRSSVKLAVRDIYESEDRIANKENREKIQAAHMDCTVDASFNLACSLGMEETVSNNERN